MIINRIIVRDKLRNIECLKVVGSIPVEMQQMAVCRISNKFNAPSWIIVKFDEPRCIFYFLGIFIVMFDELHQFWILIRMIRMDVIDIIKP